MQSGYGQHFERSAILRWIDDGNHFCPVTGCPLVRSSIVPNKTLQWKIDSWVSENGRGQQQPGGDDSPRPTNDGNGLGREPPQRFHCPLSQLVMTDPVVTGEGISFERAVILEWLEVNENCPVTGNKLLTSGVVANRRLKGEIELWHATNGINHSGETKDAKAVDSQHSKPLDSFARRQLVLTAEAKLAPNRDGNCTSLSSMLRSLPHIYGDSNSENQNGITMTAPPPPSSAMSSSSSQPLFMSNFFRKASLMAAIDDALECSGAT